jgi:hypothetical protein
MILWECCRHHNGSTNACTVVWKEIVLPAVAAMWRDGIRAGYFTGPS